MARWEVTCSAPPVTTTARGPSLGTENVTIREVEAPTTTDRIVDALQRLISLLLVAALFLWLAPRYVEEPTLMLRQRPWTSLGVGFVGVIAFGVLIFLVILVAVLLAIGVALLGLNDLVAAIAFAALVAIVTLTFVFFVSCVFGAPTWVGMAGMGFSLESAARRWTALIVGLVVVVALTSIPVVGGWLGLLVILFGLGAAILAFRPRKTTPTAVEPSGISPSNV